MRRALLATVLAGAAALVIAALTRGDNITYDLGVLPAGVVAILEPGQEVCQGPVGMAERADAVSFWLGPGGFIRGPATVTVREAKGSRVLARAEMRQQEIPIGFLRLPFDRQVPRDADVALCLKNEGLARLEVLGDLDTASGLAPPRRFAGRVLSNPTRSTDDLAIDGREQRFADIAAIFTVDENRSLLSRIPAAFSRAARFKPDLVGAWTWWVLLALGLVGAPLALMKALPEEDGS